MLSPYEEWVVVGRKLLEFNPEATMWDLITLMYEHKTGCEMIDIPNESEIVNRHMQGQTKGQIAKALNCTTMEVGQILESIGFKGFRKTPNIVPCELLNGGTPAPRRCVREVEVYKEYLNAGEFR